MGKKHLRVLAINGGGIRGYMPAVVLDHISRNAKKEIPELFDFIIGTSVGGILASAYTMPKTFSNEKNRSAVKYNATEVLNLLVNNKDKIFSKVIYNTKLGIPSEAYGPLYDRNTLDNFL